MKKKEHQQPEIQISTRLADLLVKYPGRTIPDIVYPSNSAYGRCIDWASGVSVWVQTVLIRTGTNAQLQAVVDQIQALDRTKTVQSQSPMRAHTPENIIQRSIFDRIRDSVAAIIPLVQEIERKQDAIQTKTTRQLSRQKQESLPRLRSHRHA